MEHTFRIRENLARAGFYYIRMSHLITQQLKSLHGARLFHRRRKKAADGSPGYLAPKIFHRSKQSSVAMPSMDTAHALTALTLSGSRSALKRLPIHVNYHSLFSGLQKIIHQRMAPPFLRLKRSSLQIQINSLNRGLNQRSSAPSTTSPSTGLIHQQTMAITESLQCT
jgi:hypothetical protein